MLIVLTGKTASGKDTIKQALLEKYPNLVKIITTTSRTPRNGEVDGVDYHFLTRDQFEAKIASDEFAEYVEYGGNLYGTYKRSLKGDFQDELSRSPYKIGLDQVLTADLLWRIDPSRAGHVRELLNKLYPNQKALVIYVTVSDEVVLQRLKNRGLSEEEIHKRMADDKKIWQENQSNYDFVVENVPGKLNSTLDEIVKMISISKES